MGRTLGLLALLALAGCGEELSSTGLEIVTEGPAFRPHNTDQPFLWPVGVDVNNDGYSDVVIGNSGHPGAQNREGVVYTYFGDADGFPADWTAPDNVVFGTVAHGHFGSRVDVAGDVDNDGDYDVVVLARHGEGTFPLGDTEQLTGCDNGGGSATAWLLGGTPSGLGYHGWFWSPGSGKCIQWAGGVGDLNNDGYDDIGVAVQADDAVYLFEGGQFGPSSVPTSFVGVAHAGRHIAGIGDVNADGWDDLGLVALNYGLNDSRGSVLGGANSLPPVEDWSTGTRFDDRIIHVTGGADWNRDGYADFAFADTMSDSDGKASFFYGSETWAVDAGPEPDYTDAADFTIQGTQQFGSTLESVQVVGDVNGDTFPDVLVGATNFHGSFGNFGGNERLFLGDGTAVDPTAAHSQDGPANDHRGMTFSLGDVNGDGLADWAALLPVWSDGDEVGDVRFYLGEPSGLGTTATWFRQGNHDGSNLGPVFNLGDINDDGFEDAGIGEPGFTDIGADQGAAQIHTGIENGLEASAVGPAGAVPGDEFGAAMAGQSDVNRDGSTDYAVGSPGAAGAGSNRGRVDVFFGGGALPDSSTDWTYEGLDDDGRLGSSVLLGDFDRNGWGDLVVGEPGWNSGEGRVHLFLGGTAGLSATPDWSGEGGAASCALGTALAAGDFTGDGVDDFAVGGPGCQGGEGEARVYSLGLGGTTPVADWTFDGDGASGTALAAGGHRSGTGPLDLLVGSPLNDDVFPGGGRLSAVNDGSLVGWIEGDAVGDQVGASVAAGDIDLDGQTDWIAGAPGYGDTLGDQGGVYVRLAPGVGDNDPNHILVGETAGEGLGSHLAVGDWNRDGAADILAGGVTFSAGPDTVGVARAFFAFAADAGVPVGPRYVDVLDPATNLPVAPGSTVTGDQIRVRATAIPLGGRTQARLVVELKEHNIPFDGVGTVTTDWEDTGFRTFSLTHDVTGLDELTPYRARARIQYRRKYAAAHPQTQWLYAGAPGRTESVVVATPCFGDFDGDLDPDCTDPDDDDDGDLDDTDCDDFDPSIYAGAPEIPDDTIDQDCNGIDAITCFVDGDGDGYGDVVAPGLDGTCDEVGIVALDGDCADDNPAVNPGEADICDGLDTDCNGNIGATELDDDGDGSVNCLDCNDVLNTVFPGAPELCDGVDNDCNGTPDAVDEVDADGDFFLLCLDDCDDGDAGVNPSASEVICDGADNDCDVLTLDGVDGDGDGSTECDDCDDGDASIYPGAPEVCDGVLQNCGGTLPADELDNDGDLVLGCDDCNDGDPAINPLEEEVCNGVDDDCEPTTTATDEVDADGDGHLLCDDDCADDDPDVYGGAPELCDGNDQDCDGVVPADESDFDGDGHRGCEECDDTTPLASPSNEIEHCDGLDNTCDGDLADEQDGDGDGFVACEPWLGDSTLQGGDCLPDNPDGYPGAPEPGDSTLDLNCDSVHGEGEDVDQDGTTATDGDCVDTDGSIFPGAEEVCDGVDNDCDGVLLPGELTDADDDGSRACVDCDDTQPTVHPEAAELCDGFDTDCNGSREPAEADVDGDGYFACDGDCDDGDPAVFPGQIEDDTNGVDDDCDGTVDVCADGDSDGSDTCSGDCDDDDADVNPGATEICNGRDDTCDGTIDEGFDTDGDGWTTCAGDCADTLAESGGVDPATIHPQAPPNCDDGVDNDCDDATSESLDLDGDGWIGCPPTGEAGDCWEGNDLVFPGADEQCDFLDNDCDEAVDEGFDEDEDGVTTCAGDCDDLLFSAHFGAEEVCDDGVDNDCDGDVDDGCGTDPDPTPTPGPAVDEFVLPHGCVCDAGGTPELPWLGLLLLIGLRRRSGPRRRGEGR